MESVVCVLMQGNLYHFGQVSARGLFAQVLLQKVARKSEISGVTLPIVERAKLPRQE
jgi:hypothetical protein